MSNYHMSYKAGGSVFGGGRDLEVKGPDALEVQTLFLSALDRVLEPEVDEKSVEPAEPARESGETVVVHNHHARPTEADFERISELLGRAVDALPDEEPEPGPDWREIDREELRVGDVVRVMLGVSDHYEPERRITGEFTTAGYLPAVGIESGIQSPIAPSNIYSSIQVDANRRGPELVTEEPQETFEFEEIEFGDIEKGDYIRSTYRHCVKEGVADHLNTYPSLKPDWATNKGEIIAGADAVGEVPLKIERRVQWEGVEFGDIEHGDYIRTTYADGDVQEGFAQQYVEFEACEDDWRDADGHFVCNADDDIAKIERKVK